MASEDFDREDGGAVYQCDECGDEFNAYDAAKYHAVTVEMRPVNPSEVISRV